MLGEAAVPIRLSVLLTGFQTDLPSLVADGLLGLFLVAYLVSVRRLRLRGRSWSKAALACYASGLVLVFVAVGSGLAAYDDDNFPAHVVQHILLMMVAPPLLVLGRPLTLFLQASSRAVKSAGARLLHGRVLRIATGWGVSVVYFGFMWVYFLTPLYGWSERWQPLHDTVHCVCLLLGLCYWQFVLAPDRTALQSSHMRRIAAIVIGMPAELYLGFVLHGLGRSIGPGTTPASVEAGGETFWWLAMLVTGVAIAASLVQWIRESERAASRLDAAAARAGEPGWLFDPLVGMSPQGPSSSGQGEISRG